MSDQLSKMAKNLADSVTLSASKNSASQGTILGGYTHTNTVNTGAVSGAISGTAIPSITISSGTGISNPWTTTTATPWLGNGISTDAETGGKLILDGEGADVEINGESLMGLMKEIRERLNLITINEKMEKEWDELRALGEQYRALEAKLKEQGAMWARLKAMPAPDIE